MEHRRANLWDMGFGSTVSIASQEACGRIRPLMVALCRFFRGSRLASLVLSDDIRHAVLIGMGNRQCPALDAELFR